MLACEVIWISPDIALYRLAIRHGWAEFRLAHPPAIVAVFMLPRVVFQVAFLSLIGGLAGPAGQRFAFIGAGFPVVALCALVYAGLALALEREDEIAPLIRLLGRSPMAVSIVRSWPYLAEGLLFWITGVAVAGSALGLGEVAVRLIPLIYLAALAGTGMLGLGLALATVALRGYELILLNAVNFGLIVLDGAIIPLGRLGVIGHIARLLPGTNALLAVRAHLDGKPIGGLAADECLVVILWLSLALLADRVVARRARLGRGPQ